MFYLFLAFAPFIAALIFAWISYALSRKYYQYAISRKFRYARLQQFLIGLIIFAILTIIGLVVIDRTFRFVR